MAYWWAESWLRDPGRPKTCISLLVSGTRSQDSWQRGLRCLGAGGDQLMGMLGPIQLAARLQWS